MSYLPWEPVAFTKIWEPFEYKQINCSQLHHISSSIGSEIRFCGKFARACAVHPLLCAKTCNWKFNSA